MKTMIQSIKKQSFESCSKDPNLKKRAHGHTARNYSYQTFVISQKRRLDRSCALADEHLYQIWRFTATPQYGHIITFL